MTVLLAAISLLVGTDTVCHKDPVEWDYAKMVFVLPAQTSAYYLPRTRTIHLGPGACRFLGTPSGAQILAHELGHAWQHDHGLPLDEMQAERIKFRTWRHVYELICRVRSCA